MQAYLPGGQAQLGDNSSRHKELLHCITKVVTDSTDCKVLIYRQVLDCQQHRTRLGRTTAAAHAMSSNQLQSQKLNAVTNLVIALLIKALDLVNNTVAGA